MTEQTSLPLEGLRVLDLSRVLAGPMSAMALGDLGAEVIKVEHPQRGDDTREWGLPLSTKMTTYFNSANRNKYSIGLDLHAPEGREIVHSLVASCDVLIHNFKRGGAEGLGLGYAELKVLNPRLIYCSISGYDSSGPDANRPGYDLVVQAEGGLMAINGETGQGPLKFGIAIVDLTTGMYATQAILAALYKRERLGQGSHIEMALYDCGTALSAYVGLDALKLGRDPEKYGNNHPSIMPYGVFSTNDGPLTITVGNNQQFHKFCNDVIGRRDLFEDPRFATNLLRMNHRAELMHEIESELASRSREELLTALNRHGIPCGEVNGLHEALTSRRTVDAGLVVTQHNPEGEDTYVLAPPYRLDGRRPPVRKLPPQLGQHTDAVLTALLGLEPSKIADLRSRGVV